MWCQIFKTYLLLAKPLFTVWDPTEGLEHLQRGEKHQKNKAKGLTEYWDKKPEESKTGYGIWELRRPRTHHLLLEVTYCKNISILKQVVISLGW